VADRKAGFVFSFYGVIDLLAILPFYIASGVDLRSILALRMLRLFRAFKLVRYSKAMQRFHRAFVIAKEEVALFCFWRVCCCFSRRLGYTTLKAKRSRKGSGLYSIVFGGRWRPLQRLYWLSVNWTKPFHS